MIGGKVGLHKVGLHKTLEERRSGYLVLGDDVEELHAVEFNELGDGVVRIRRQRRNLLQSIK